MKINFYIGHYAEEHTDFYINQLTDKLKNIANELQHRSFIFGYHHSKIYSLKINSLIRFYTSNNQVITTDGIRTYQVKQRIYELINELPSNFIQISRSEIINFHDIDHLEIVKGGTIKLVFTDHEYTFVSRRYVPKIRKKLGI